jgi:hypothetical protein
MDKKKKKNKKAILIIIAFLIMAGGVAIRVLPVASIGALLLLGILVNDMISKMNS